MPLSAPKSGFLVTRVGRQTLTHFLLAALLPVLVVSGFGIRYVRQVLEAEATERLQRTARSAAQSLLAELTAARSVNDRPAAPDSNYAPGSFDPAEESHLREGGVLLRVVASRDSADRDATVQILRRLSDGQVVGTTVPPSKLWLILDALIGADRTRLCIFVVGTWQRVHCAAPMLAATEARLRDVAIQVAGQDEPARDDSLIVAYRDLYLRFELASMEWRMVVAQDRAQAFAPAAGVTTSLALMVALAIVSAFAFAHRQIRRSTEPLEALRDATRRVAGGDLGTPVTIQSRDEYGELGAAFNTMTSALAGQLDLLHRMDAVDEASLRQRRVDAIAETALEGFRQARTQHFAAIAIIDENDKASVTQWWTDSSAPHCQRARGSLGSDERQVLLSHPRLWIRGPEDAVREIGHGGVSHAPAATRIVLPLIHDEELLGAITIEHGDAASSHAEDDRAARRIADRVALGIANVRLLSRLDALSSGTLRAFARAIDANSHWTAGHSERVTRLALVLGRQLDLPRSELSILYRGGLMHDIGKIGIPPAVLDKATLLSADERELIERHPVIGEQILKPIPAFADALPIVRSHHERFDGTGYPDRLAGEDIPWLARVLAVADVFDALASDRPYRAGLSHRATAAMIESGAGTHFDPRVVAALLAIEFDGSMSLDGSDLVELRVDVTDPQVDLLTTYAGL